MAEAAQADGGSQTLARGLRALALIGEALTPITVPELAVELGIHRSMAYRLVKTLEQAGFVERSNSGTLAVGARLAGIARNVARDLQAVAFPELLAAAAELDLTTFLVVHDGEAAVTLASAEPPHANTTIGQRPGTRHPVDRGAPGRSIRSQLDPAGFPPRRSEVSHDEVVDGVTAIAVPLVIAGRPASSIAALYPSSRKVDLEQVADRLEAAATRIATLLH
ncbi:IclR family transcriptional regulator [uncultured Amnibacterium sp.]|uniref:IclR family transcriptional regulator n=1 Tax=uncultured Amnibacterium sp. TaxID=1631851 RepID=UPI0035CA587F